MREHALFRLRGPRELERGFRIIYESSVLDRMNQEAAASLWVDQGRVEVETGRTFRGLFCPRTHAHAH